MDIDIIVHTSDLRELCRGDQSQLDLIAAYIRLRERYSYRQISKAIMVRWGATYYINRNTLDAQHAGEDIYKRRRRAMLTLPHHGPTTYDPPQDPSCYHCGGYWDSGPMILRGGLYYCPRHIPEAPLAA